jgi:hypothetical protein
LFLESGDAVVDWGWSRGGDGFGHGGFAGEQVGPAGFFCAGGFGHEDDERVGFAGGQFVQGVLGGVVVGEGVHAAGAVAEFGDGLRSAEQKHGKDRQFTAREVEEFAHPVAVLLDAAARFSDEGGEAQFAERFQGGTDVGILVGGDGVAVGFLVAGVGQGVQRERVIVGRGEVFFDERAEYSGFDGVKNEVHTGSMAPGSRAGQEERLRLCCNETVIFMRSPAFLFLLPALLIAQGPLEDDAESLHIVNVNLDFKPGWTLQLHSRVRTFEDMGSFNQFRAGPILMVQFKPKLLGLAGYYFIDQNRRVTYQDFHIHRAWLGAQVRAVARPRWTMDARSITERFISSEFTDYYRFRNRLMINGNGNGNGRKWLPFISYEVLRQQSIWYGRFTAGTQYRPAPGVLTSIGYEYRPSPIGSPSHILATMIQFERVRRIPPHID